MEFGSMHSSTDLKSRLFRFVASVLRNPWRVTLNKKCGDKAKKEGFQREARLFNSWRDMVRDEVAHICEALFGYDFLTGLCERETAVVFEVAFDYNRGTFMPTEQPTLLTAESLEGTNPDLATNIRQAYKSMEEERKPAKARAKTLIMVVKRGAKQMVALMPTFVQPKLSGARSKNWDDLVLEILAKNKLNSRNFAAWAPLLSENLNSQIQAIRSQPQFEHFVLNALHIQNSQSKHKTHMVKVSIEMGHGLGEVKAITKYYVVRVSDVVDELERSCKKGARDHLDYDKKYILDLEGSPMLLAFRKKRPHLALLPVLFTTRSSDTHFLLPEMCDIPQGGKLHTASLCDNNAHKEFEDLKRMDFPPVKSPVLG